MYNVFSKVLRKINSIPGQSTANEDIPDRIDLYSSKRQPSLYKIFQKSGPTLGRQKSNNMANKFHQRFFPPVAIGIVPLSHLMKIDLASVEYGVSWGAVGRSFWPAKAPSRPPP